MDALSIKQLNDQLYKRQSRLDMLIVQNAPKSVIEAAHKQLMLTRRRIDRLQYADYEEDMRKVTRLGGDNA